MADIPVKPRRTGMPWWIWLVAALVVAVLAWFIFTALTRDAADDVEDERARPPATGLLLGVPASADTFPLTLTQTLNWR